MSQHSRQLASIMMMHAYKQVAIGHTSNLKRWFANKASQKWRTTSGGELAAAGVGITVGVGVLIAGTVLTGGLLPGVIAGIAGGTYVVKKAITGISFEHGRLNRNWLKNYDKAFSMDSKNYADAIGMEAKDAIRRAIDHYNITRTIIKNELKPNYAGSFDGCNDAINLAKATARFIHHSDKTRNYLLPCIDVCILLLLQYQEMSTKWNRSHAQLEKALEAWFDYHESTLIGHCNRDPNEVCYGTAAHGSLTPRKPHASAGKSGSANLKAAGSTVTIDSEAVDIMEVVNALAEGSVKSIEKAMQRNGSKPAATRNFHSVMPGVSQHDQLQSSAGSEKRFKQLINDAYGSADRPGYLSQMTRKLSHGVSRRTKGELALAIFSEIADVGASLATPFIPNLPLGEVLAKSIDGASLISGGVSATTKATSLFAGIKSFSVNKKAAMESGLIDSTKAREMIDESVKSAGVTVENLIVKTGTHFREAIDACKKLEEIGGCTISNCRQAWEYSTAIAEAAHHFGKMEKYLMMTLCLIVHVGTETVVWSTDEPALWREMEERVAGWMEDPLVHQACRDSNTHCYGHKVTRIVRGGTVSSFLHGRRDEIIDYQTPHKPL